MESPPVIRKERELLASQDYAGLRERGLEYVRELSGKVWTDHNAHDPGITALEVLCYALTDLGYRTAFDVQDLLSPDPQSTLPAVEHSFFPAHRILPNTALTLRDYRRLLMKIEGVRNAWLDPMTDAEQAGYRDSEIPVFADCAADALTFEAKSATGEANQRVRLSGLYRVLLELEVDDVLGPLNESAMVHRIPRGPLEGVVLSLDSEDPDFPGPGVELDQVLDAVLGVAALAETGARFEGSVQVRLEDASEPTLENLVVRVVQARPSGLAEPVEVSAAKVRQALEDDEADGIVHLFWRKRRIRRRIVEAACCVLHANRNLCEDYLSVDVVPTERVAVCADIELTPEADLEEVQARVLHAIEKYLNPPVPRYSLEALLDEGRHPDEIFQAPYVDPDFRCGGERVFTKAGFVKDEDLDTSELRTVVHTSDIINVVMDVDGVVAIRNVQLRKHDDDGHPVGASERWCLEISPGHQPALLVERSKLLFFKDEIPYRARLEESEATLDDLREMDRQAAYVEPNQVLTAPRGRFRSPGAFFSVQHDFPETYGIGPARLPAGIARERVAKAHQLKAYLTFFDQMLADYLAQLAQVGRLFSLNKELGRTYFSRFLRDLDEETGQGVASVDPGEVFPEEFFQEPPALESMLEDFTRPNPLTESEEIFLERRNRILDHLLARFAERFTDYALMLYDLEGDRLLTDRELIDDKIDFLRKYPEVSRERGRALDYCPEDAVELWDTDNVSGLEKRVSRLMGMKSYERRDLACAGLFDALLSTRKMGAGAHRLEIKDETNAVLFKSEETFASQADALAEAEKVFPHLRREAAYEVDDSGGTGAVFYTVSGGGVELRHDELFDDELDAFRSIRSVVDRYDQLLAGEACEEDGLEEGFHLIEHILLRPTTDDDELLDVCLGEGCAGCGDEDPYSFRITVVLPYWPERFRELGFRRFFQRTLRQETPAHVHARICWVGHDEMVELDRRYRAWLELRCTGCGGEPGGEALTEAARELVEILRRLKTVYPAARLHDCAEGDDENLVRLGTTNIGIF